jgi:mxaJ protein
MRHSCRAGAAALLLLGGCAAAPDERSAPAAAIAASPSAGEPLRVCADPNNMPFSNQREEGFENRLAELVAEELGTSVRYTWWASRRGFIRNTLNAGACDVVMGVPRDYELVRTTRPYYRSTYVFLTPEGTAHVPASLLDDELRRLRVGVQIVGDDGASSPPAHILAERGIVTNVVGYSVLGDYSTDSPPSRIVAAVAAGEVDVAIAWGAMAGYFAARQAPPLRVTPVPQTGSRLPMAFDVAIGVRKADAARAAQLDAILASRSGDIARILDEYRVVRVEDSNAEEVGRLTGIEPATP